MAHFKDVVETWRGPVLFALFTALVIWMVWYFTKTPCIMVKADAGLCNPSVLANFINLEILIKAGGGGLTVGTLKGGYNTYMLNNMLNKEREARLQAEQALAEERQRADEERRQAEQRIIEERQKVDELIREFREERQQNSATQQAMLEALAQLVQQQNGNEPQDSQ